MSNADEVGAQLYSKLAELLAPSNSLASTPVVLLLEPSGKDVDLKDFRDVKDPNDPEKGIEAFSDLVNSVPIPGPTFVDSSHLCDSVYKFIIESAMTSGDSNDPVSNNAAREIMNARFDLDHIVLPREDFPLDLTHPATAEPVRWWDTAMPWSEASFTIGSIATLLPKPAPTIAHLPKIPSLTWRSIPSERYLSELTALIRPHGNLSLTKARALRPQFGNVTRMSPLTTARIEPNLEQKKTTTTGTLATRIQTLGVRSVFEMLEKAPLKLRYCDLIYVARLLDTKAHQTAIQPTDSGFKISFQYCVVSIKRPWFHSELFDMPGWWLPGFAAHSISNGLPTNNPGLLPAITTRFLAIRNLFVRAVWSDGDRAKAEQAGKAAGVMSFGPFALTGDVHFDGAELRCSTPQIVAWLAAILPACPH
jgi:hypothetical protein